MTKRLDPIEPPEQRGMLFAYADPPYVGQAHRYGEAEVDHGLLIALLESHFPDGWALSCHTPSLAALLPLCPPGTRVLAWCKTWASWKPGVMPKFAWEPVILRGGRKKGTWLERDWFASPAHQIGFPGSKPPGFSFWLFRCFGANADDTLVDIFAGSGAVAAAWEQYRAQVPLVLREKGMTLPLLAESAGCR